MTVEQITMAEATGEQPGKYIELEAPEYLALEQNFYDQEPFATAVQTVSEKTTIPTEHLRQFLGHHAKGSNIDRMTFTTGSKQHRSSKRLAGVFMDTYLDMSKAKIVELLPTYTSAIRELLQLLNDYPGWKYYVDTNVAGGQYKYDGTLKSHKVVAWPESIPTYAKWAAETLPKLLNQRLVGIKEIFPQDFATESPATAQQPAGPRRENRRWRILISSELVRK